MFHVVLRLCFVSLALLGTMGVARAAEPASPEASEVSASARTRGPTRIDFDDRLIQGQTHKSGAVYLYDRKALELPTLLRTPDRFRSRIESESHAR